MANVTQAAVQGRNGPPIKFPVADASTLPKARDAEICLLGEMILGPDHYDPDRRRELHAERIREIRDLVTAADFYAIPADYFTVACEVFDEHGTLEATLVKAELVRRNILDRLGGMDALLAILEGSPNAGNFRAYAAEMREATHRRQAIAQAERVREMAYNPDVDLSDISDLLTDTGKSLSSGNGLDIVRAADIEPRRLAWLWAGCIPMGKLTVIAGDPGLGKSMSTLDIAARVSQGLAWPVGEDPGTYHEPGHVLVLSAEDDPEDTLRPRLEAACANLEHVHIIRGTLTRGRSRVFSLQTDIDRLDRALEGMKDCKLVIIDPISAYLGTVDSHRDADVRGLLTPLADMAARRNVAVVLVSHLNKGTGKAAYRVSGSIGFVAAARAVWQVSRDPDDPARVLYAPSKMNLCRCDQGMAYRINTDGPTPRVQWEAEPIHLTAQQLAEAEAEAPAARRERKAAADAIREVLRDGPRPGTEVIRQVMAEVDCCDQTVRLAFRELGGKITRVGFKDGVSMWSLPAPK